MPGAIKKDPMSLTGLAPAGTFHIWQMPGGHGSIVDAARPPLSFKGPARSVRLPPLAVGEDPRDGKIPAFLPRKPLFPWANPQAGKQKGNVAGRLSKASSEEVPDDAMCEKLAADILVWASENPDFIHVNKNSEKQAEQTQSERSNLLSAVGQGVNRVDQGTGLGWAALGIPAANYPVSKFNKLYMAGVLDELAPLDRLHGSARAHRVRRHVGSRAFGVDTPTSQVTAGFTPDDPQGFRTMQRYIRGAHPDVRVMAGRDYARRAEMPQGWRDMQQRLSGLSLLPKEFRKNLPDLFSTMWEKIRRGPAQTAGAYNPSDKTILYNATRRSPSILAHELGHHLGPRWLNKSRVVSSLGRPLGVLGALMSSDEDTSRNMALAGTASQLPTLASEFDASRRGMNILSKLKLSNPRRAFVGLPTYLAAASLPMLAHLGKKGLGGFESSK
jgi:hypothetical protein